MRKTSLGELIADSITHGIGAILSIIGLVLIILKADTAKGYISGIVYGVCLIFLYVSSTLFHSFPENFKRTRAVFQRLDHSGVFLLIVGTYTPLIIYALSFNKAIIYLSAMWLLTVVGIVFKSIWINRFKSVHLFIYLLMGWSVVFYWQDVYGFIEEYISLLILGGLAYTIGVIFYLARFKYNHFIWHLFVIAGSVFHFLVIYQIIS
ncbi:MAG: hemolysin III family protein [Candidatus Izimaplasma sp.]|nr:hemolysin III family protein [Candidatus Izimaplasma bacterium]